MGRDGRSMLGEERRDVAAVMEANRSATVHAVAQVVVQVVVHVVAPVAVDVVGKSVEHVVARVAAQVMARPLAGVGMQGSLAPANAHHCQGTNDALRNSNTA